MQVRSMQETSGISLAGRWRLSFGPQQEPASQMHEPLIPSHFDEVPAQVPGNIELDLIDAGLLPQRLDHGDNIYRLKPFETYQFWYRRRFAIDAARPLRDALLVLRGIDTFATVWINNIRIGATANMLVPHELRIGSVLRHGDNEIVIAIDSALLWAHGRPVDAASWAMENNWESLAVRKPPHAYGWDIMPRAILGGIWRDIGVAFPEPFRFENVYLATLQVEPEARTAQLLARWSLVAPTHHPSPLTIVLRVVEPSTGRALLESRFRSLGLHGEFSENLRGVDAWWPKGYGEASLYRIELSALGEDEVPIALWSSNFGFRTIELRNSEILENDSSGEFRFLVNGIDIFIKGSNWVPLDALHSRDAARLDETFALAVDLNCNMLRCWGGNVYEDQPFFDLCDRHGIMVWQDFALACALYPQTAEFHEAMQREADVLVPLLRNHPSLVLWAGNNEIDQTYGFAMSTVDPNADDLISRHILSGACRRLDPHRAYLPSSPYYGPEVWKRGDLLACPEDHLWGPRDDFKGPFYTTHRALFASEIGYHGCPPKTSLENMMRPDQLWPWQGSEDWLTHAVRPQRESTKYNYRIPLLATQIEVLFGRVPDMLDEYILASQISQAEALKFFIEMFRIGKGRRSGILWWNIRDGWPQISDAVVDYYGNRKLAYEAARRAQADVLVMLGEPYGGHQDLVAVNDTATQADIAVAVTTGNNDLLCLNAVVPSNSRLHLGSIIASSDFRVIDIDWSGPTHAGRNHYLGGRRPFDLGQVIAIYRRLMGDRRVAAQIAPGLEPAFDAPAAK